MNESLNKSITEVLNEEHLPTYESNKKRDFSDNIDIKGQEYDLK